MGDGGSSRESAVGRLAARLIAIEARFGGLQKNVPRRRVSPRDPRTTTELARGAMQGGDRMAAHGYAHAYAEHLLPFLARPARAPRLNVVELGILRGSGLALLCELFPDARVIGLDVDLSHWTEHNPKLRALGAFAKNEPEVHEYDELARDAAGWFSGILGARNAVNVFIHDALHYDEAIVNTFAHVHRHLDEVHGFRAFLEDNATVGDRLAEECRDLYAVHRYDRLTVIAPI